MLGAAADHPQHPDQHSSKASGFLLAVDQQFGEDAARGFACVLDVGSVTKRLVRDWLGNRIARLPTPTNHLPALPAVRHDNHERVGQAM
jgi:hypothetical protein